MTEQQIRWASKHDWFVANNGDGTITVVDRYIDGSETIMVWQGTFRALRDWAGY